METSTRTRRKRGYASESSIIKSATNKILTYLHDLSKSNSDFISEPFPTEIERITAYFDENDLKDPFYLELGKFKRSARLIWKSLKIIGAFDQTLLNTIQERVDQAGEIDPDESQFQELSDIIPWNEDDLISKGANLTSEVIKRIKKGMLLGTMYNLGINTLKVIFRNLTITSWVNQEENSYIRIVRCPLCPVSLTLGKIYHHLERFHTGSLVCCIDCGKLLATNKEALSHLSVCEKGHSENVNCIFEQPVNHGSSVITSDPPKDVKWVANWRPRINSFLESIKSYIVSDEVSSTDSSESDQE